MAASRQRYFIVIPDLNAARGQSDALSFQGGSVESFATQLQSALREPSLWQKWKAMQPDPDAIDASLGEADAQATVEAHQSDLRCDVQVVTSLTHAILKHRLGLLIGSNWTLRDVAAA